MDGENGGRERRIDEKLFGSSYGSAGEGWLKVRQLLCQGIVECEWELLLRGVECVGWECWLGNKGVDSMPVHKTPQGNCASKSKLVGART
jgi:hypothetical protein